MKKLLNVIIIVIGSLALNACFLSLLSPLMSPSRVLVPFEENGTQGLPSNKVATIAGTKMFPTLGDRSNTSDIAIYAVDGNKVERGFFNHTSRFILKPGKRVLLLGPLPGPGVRAAKQNLEANLEAGKTYIMRANVSSREKIWLPTIHEKDTKRVVSRNLTLENLINRRN